MATPFSDSEKKKMSNREKMVVMWHCDWLPTDELSSFAKLTHKNNTSSNFSRPSHNATSGGQVCVCVCVCVCVWACHAHPPLDTHNNKWGRKQKGTLFFFLLVISSRSVGVCLSFCFSTTTKSMYARHFAVSMKAHTSAAGWIE